MIKEQLIKECDNKKVCIYGAGMVGELVLEHLLRKGISSNRIVFAVTSAEPNQSYMGYPVMDIHDVAKKRNVIFILAVMKKNQGPMIDVLLNIGVSDFIVIDDKLFSFLEQDYVGDFLSTHAIEKKDRQILFIASDNNSSSGAFLCLVDINIELKKRGISSLVILPQYGNGELLLKDNDIEYTYVLSKDWLVANGEENNLLGNDVAVNTLCSFIKDFNIQLVHINTTYSYVGAVAAKRMNIPYIWHIREFIREQGFWFVDEDASYKLINEANRIIPVSKYVSECYEGFDKDKINIVYDGVDVNRYYYEHNNLFKDKKIHILMPGNIIPLKGQKQLVEAANVLAKRGLDFDINFVGNGDSNYIAELNVYIEQHELAGFISFHDRSNRLEEWYRKSDIVVVCSRAEAFGRVTVEAQLSGCIVVGAECGATVELIKNKETGLLYTLYDIDNLTEQLETIICNKDKSISIARMGQINALNMFNKEKNAVKVIEIYREILGKGVNFECDRKN